IFFTLWLCLSFLIIKMFSESDIKSSRWLFLVFHYALQGEPVFFFNSRISICSGVIGEALGVFPWTFFSKLANPFIHRGLAHIHGLGCFRH
ncbi:hypothetical protein IB84_16470, partial [Vibrio cholerae]